MPYKDIQQKKEWDSHKVTCSCGCVTTRRASYRHLKSNRHCEAMKTPDERVLKIVEVKCKNNVLRYKGTVNNKQIDISVSFNKITREVAMKKLEQKIEDIYYDDIP